MPLQEYLTYNEVHRLCQEAAPRILSEFKPQLIIAIGSGGYVPARMLRSLLKQPGTPDIPIQAIGLSFSRHNSQPEYPAVTNSERPQLPTTGVIRTQWLDFHTQTQIKSLVGKRILIVDEVDDTRSTLAYAVSELKNDVEQARKISKEEVDETIFNIFVLHNKIKEKEGKLPDEIMLNHYLAARTVEDVWISYPWEAKDIDEHDNLARSKSLEISK
ncbi:unnamed protein product [Blumeria hordei]|uniref:Phosphoribosyltransferase domain-containing protein n=2 Tax=Blumeria hordei TaxID=2867405 RepID=A0A383UHL7_BLUHO|nr:HPT1/hypoxanthine-guanine phosphoribosyltransferase/Xpt1p/xanthine phosphoribosyltransferase [Blumeria hordei DH14]SZE99803.1 unnamed protein product [Blumeria hordei]